MKRLIDRDPVSGKEVWFDYDQNSDAMTITHTERVEHVLDYCASMRQIPERTKTQIKKDLVHYAIVPEVIQLEMLHKHGVDFWNPNNKRKVYSLLNDDYARFKVTNIRHNVKC
jgi:hypothetical protein